MAGDEQVLMEAGESSSHALFAGFQKIHSEEGSFAR
jgi:hypothetical protein